MDYKIFSFIFFIIFFSTFAHGEEKVESEDLSVKYEYKKRDIKEEQKKFVLRLKKDKTRVDFAIKNTKVLIGKSRNRPYLPELFLRLAELYIEKSRIVYYIRNRKGRKSSKSLDRLEANTIKNKAIEIYKRILDNFPDYESRDKVHFYIAHEYRELLKFNKMVEHYKIIMKDHKNSVYTAESFLLLGDYYFKNNNLYKAKENYESVFNYPDSSALPIAKYKMGWIYINKKDFIKAIGLFEESVMSKSSQKKMEIDTYQRVDIKLESLNDMAFSYIEVYKDKPPEHAIEYFKKYSWSRPVYTNVLEKMAYRFLIKKKWKHASVLYRHLSTLQQKAEKLLEYVRNIFECVTAMDDAWDPDKDLAIIVKALEKQKFSIHVSAKAKNKNFKDFEIYARDMLTKLHKRIVKKPSKEGFKRVANAYKIYLDFFTKSKAFREMEFNYAESLFNAKEYLEAGKYYEKVALKIKKKKEQEDKMYSAILAYYNALKNRKTLNYYQTVYSREGLRAVGKKFIKKYPKSSHAPDVMFNVAWASYDAGKHKAAIKEFKKFVKLYPQGKEAKAAVHLILDTYYLLENFKGLTNYGKRVIANNRITDSAFKMEVSDIVKAVEAKEINSLTITASRNYSKGRNRLIDIVKRHKSSSLGEQALFALIAPSMENGDLETMFSSSNQFIRKYPNSPRLEDTLGVLIDFSLNISQFRLISKYLEKFSEKLPKHKKTPDFLYKAGRIKESLGQYKEANEIFISLLEQHEFDSKRRADIIMVIAENLNKMGKSDKANQFLIKNIGVLSQIAKVKANAMIAIYFYEKMMLKEGLKYSKIAKKHYMPGYAKKDNKINFLMAQIEYNNVQGIHKKYMSIQLFDKVDNKIVKKKESFLQKLEKAYTSVIKLQSPDWALRALWQTYKVYLEFARFLKDSPLPPGLSLSQQKEYKKIINKKAEAYIEKGNQFLEASIKQAHIWEVSNPKLIKYYSDPNDSRKKQTGLGYFSKLKTNVSISEGFIKYNALKKNHFKLYKNPKDLQTMFKIAMLYTKKSDLRQALLIAQKILDELKDKNLKLKSKVYNMMGVYYLFFNEDQVAKEAFMEALEINPRNVSAKVNLAAIYFHYSHRKKAKKIYKKLPSLSVIEKFSDYIHPRAKKLYLKYK